MAKTIDKKTLALINQLNARDKAGSLNEIDKQQFKKLITGEMTINDIQSERDRCRGDWLYFINEYVWVKNKFNNPDEIPEILRQRCLGDMIKFVMYDIQVELATAIFNDDKVISTKSRQIGFTTTALACALFLLTFSNNKTVLLFSKTEKDAKETLTELKFMYDSLPFFLKRVELKRNEKELVLGGRRNSSKIIAQTSGRQSGRSQAATQLIADEADYIEGIESIYKAALFTLAATKGKLIVLSTPNLYGSWFYNMIDSARKKGKEGSGFRLIEGPQNSIPYRDQKQYDEQCKLLNYVKKDMDTELNMKQILPYDTYFHDDKLLKIEQQKHIDIIFDVVKIYFPRSKTDDYVISVDVQEEGSHFNAIMVYNLTQRRIEATSLTRMNLYGTLIEISKYYKNVTTDQWAKIMIERNRGYYLIKKFEENELSHLLLPNIRYLKKTDSYEFDIDDNGKPLKLGFVTTESTRKKALIILSEMLYKAKTLPEDLMDEATKFVIKSRGKPVGLEHDDLLMATAIGIFTVEILDQANEKKKGSKKILRFLKSYQQQSNRPHNDAKEKKETEISETVKSMVLKQYLIVNDKNFQGLDLQFLKMIEDSNEKNGVSKVGKAMMALYTK